MRHQISVHRPRLIIHSRESETRGKDNQVVFNKIYDVRIVSLMNWLLSAFDWWSSHRGGKLDDRLFQLWGAGHLSISKQAIKQTTNDKKKSILPPQKILLSKSLTESGSREWRKVVVESEKNLWTRCYLADRTRAVEASEQFEILGNKS